MGIIRDLWNGIFAVGGAAGASQGPALMQQYLQRLGGTVDGMRRAAESLEQVPAELNLQIIALHRHLLELQAATPLTRPYVFLRDLDPRVLDGTLASFEPAVPLTAEAMVYALVGLVIAVLFGGFLAWLFSSLLWRPLFRPRRGHALRP